MNIEINYELRKRVVSSIIILFLTTLSILMGGIFNIVFFSICFMCSISEWYNICLRICKIKKKRWIFYNESTKKDLVDIEYETSSYSLRFFVILSCGSLYIFLGLYHLFLLSIFQSPAFYVLGVAWTTDTFAYIGGKTIQGKKLCPSISPGKTVSGFLTGTIASGIFSLISRNFTSFFDFILIFIQGFGLGVISQLGDLLESFFKRQAFLKNSGHLIPGHGGILDRIDGILAISLLLMITTMIFGK
jgi:CDP-diglyceride synthetase